MLLQLTQVPSAFHQQKHAIPVDKFTNTKTYRANKHIFTYDKLIYQVFLRNWAMSGTSPTATTQVGPETGQTRLCLAPHCRQ